MCIDKYRSYRHSSLSFSRQIEKPVYIRKSTRGNYGDEALSVALDSPMRGRSLMSVSQKFGVESSDGLSPWDAKLKTLVLSN